MSRRIPGPVILLLLAMIPLAPCSKKKPPRCSLDGQTTLGTPLSEFPWPRFRFDMANSANTPSIVTSNNVGTKWCFGLTAPVTIESSPVVGLGQQDGAPQEQLYFGSSDGQFHVLNTANGVPNDLFTSNLAVGITIRSAITSTALLGTNGNVFFATGAAQVLQTDDTGKLLHQATLSGFVGASPNIADDGEVFIGTEGGAFSSVCPNGVPRYSSLIAPTQSTAGATSNDFCMNFYGDPNSENCPRAFVGASDSQVSAFDLFGRQHWAFFASAPVVNAIIVQESTVQNFNRAFIIDSSGHVFVVSLINGALLTRTPLVLPGPVSASAAAILGSEVPPTPPTATLYVADQTGMITAVETDTNDDGTVQLRSRHVFTAGGAINSSPALSTGGPAPVLVFGADRFVYAVVDAGATCEADACVGGPNDGEACATDDDCALLWKFDAGATIGTSSAAIDVDGTVYIGTQGVSTQGGTMLALGDNGLAFNPCITATPNPSPTPTPTPAS